MFYRKKVCNRDYLYIISETTQDTLLLKLRCSQGCQLQLQLHGTADTPTRVGSLVTEYMCRFSVVPIVSKVGSFIPTSVQSIDWKMERSFVVVVGAYLPFQDRKRIKKRKRVGIPGSIATDRLTYLYYHKAKSICIYPFVYMLLRGKDKKYIFVDIRVLEETVLSYLI